MRFKKVITCVLSTALIISSLSITPIVKANESTDSSLFTVASSDLSIVTGYVGTYADVVLPSEINGVQMKGISGAFNNNAIISSVVVPEGYTEIRGSSFRNCASLKKVSLPNSLETLTGTYIFRDCKSLEKVNIPVNVSSISLAAFQGCTSPDLVIDIKSTSLTKIGSSAFKNVVGTIKVYSQEMYDLISSKATTANVVLVSSTDPTDPPEPSLDYTNLNKALEDGEAVDTSKYTEATVKALEDAILSGKAVKDNTSATQTDIDNAVKAIEDAIKALELKPIIDYSKIDAAIAEAEDIIANHSDEYTEESIQFLSSGIDTAKVSRATENQAEIDWAANMLEIRIKDLVKIDINAMLAELQTVIGTANALDESDYTDESYKVLADAIAAASELNATSNYKDILAAQSNIENAVKKLILKPLEEFVKVYKNGAVATLTKGTADSKMNGATSIRVTFNCAPDVSYNPNASIELKAVVNGTESYEKFIGKDSNYTNGANGWTETLALTNPISEGQSYEITAFTYAWNNAADYVYAVSKVEFLDAEGKVLSKVTANTIAMDDLKEALAEAKTIDTGKYTDESVKALTDALEKAEAITDKATVADIKAATKAIRDAIAKLEEKIKTGNVSGTINVSDKNAETEMTITAVSADGTGKEISVTATSMGTYTIENLETGDYTLTISGGKYAARKYEVTVTEGGITQDVELNPYGDINGDGEVTTKDVGLANAHEKGVRTLEGYAFICANVSKEAGVTTLDVDKINSHAKGVRALW